MYGTSRRFNGLKDDKSKKFTKTLQRKEEKDEGKKKGKRRKEINENR